MSDVTRILTALDCGDRSAADRLLPLVYDELRKLAAKKLAQEKPGHTLDATALVHEAYLRLVGGGRRGSSPPNWDHRGHFFAAAAEAMRRILVEHARRKGSLKRGGNCDRIPLAGLDAVSSTRDDPSELLAIHELLDQLAERSPRRAELVKLRYFAGCTLPKAAALLAIAPATAEDDWAYAKAWLRREWSRGDHSEDS